MSKKAPYLILSSGLVNRTEKLRPSSSQHSDSSHRKHGCRLFKLKINHFVSVCTGLLDIVQLKVLSNGTDFAKSGLNQVLIFCHKIVRHICNAELCLARKIENWAFITTIAFVIFFQKILWSFNCIHAKDATLRHPYFKEQIPKRICIEQQLFQHCSLLSTKRLFLVSLSLYFHSLPLRKSKVGITLK